MSLGLSPLPPEAESLRSTVPSEHSFLRFDAADSEPPCSLVDGLADNSVLCVDTTTTTTQPPDCREALLDSPGLTLHRTYDDVCYQRFLLGQQLAAKLESVGHTAIAHKLRECRQHLSVGVCNACGYTQRFYNRCDIFYCPQCSPGLAARRLESLLWFVERMKQPKHIVLTIRNVPRLTTQFLRQAQQSLTRLRRRKLFAGCRSGLWAMEITNKGRGWHVHFHLVADCPWLDVRTLSETWRECNRLESGVVWIESASRGSLKANLPRYVTKYTGKGFQLQNWAADLLGEFVTAIRGVRTFGVYGDLLGARTAHREFLKSVRDTRRRCQCGACSWSYYTQHEYEWHSQFTGFDRHRTNSPPPRHTIPYHTQLQWHASFLSGS